MSRNVSRLVVLVLRWRGRTGPRTDLEWQLETGLAYSGGPNILAGTPRHGRDQPHPDLYDNTGADGWNIGGIPAYDNMFKGMVACQGDRFIGFAASPRSAGSTNRLAQTTGAPEPGQAYTLSACMAVDDLGKDPHGGPYSWKRGEVDAC
ncbi:MAG: hypothetical protein IPJ41_07140 [Phycisphaerales bacterium]|nr:hypothetical protein [Phycisphaerales bacterium]